MAVPESVGNVLAVAPEASIVIALAALVMTIPAPAVSVPYAGAPALDPISNCPSVPAEVVKLPEALD